MKGGTRSKSLWIPGRTGALVLCLCVASLTACPRPNAPASPEEACASPVSGSLALDEWREETLSWTRGICTARYKIRTPAAGRLRISVYAPSGQGLPAYALELLDTRSQIVSRATASNKSPQRVQTAAAAGEYTLVVRLSGESQEDLAISISPEFDRSGGPPPPPDPEPDPPEDDPTPVEPDPPPVVDWIKADVLKLETKDGRAAVVILSIGAGSGARVGARGELVNPDDRVLAQIEIEEVSEDASRARIVGELRGWITPRTSARIQRSGR